MLLTWKCLSLICISSVQTYLFSCPCLFENSHGYPIDIVNLTCPKLTSWSPESLLLTGFSSHLWQLQPLVAQLRNLGVFAPCLLTASHSPRLVHQQTSLFFLWNISEPTSAATNSVLININHCYLSIGLIQMHLIWSLLPLSLLQSSLYTAAGATQQLMRWLKALQETEVDKIQA